EKYPKVGDPNPEVRLGVVGSSGGPAKRVSPPGSRSSRDRSSATPSSSKQDIYIPPFRRLRDGGGGALVLNRAQNQLDLYFIDAESGKSRRALRETSDTWIEMDDSFKILKSGDKFLWPSWRDGHTHLYLYSFDKSNLLAAEAKLENQVTKGEF